MQVDLFDIEYCIASRYVFHDGKMKFKNTKYITLLLDLNFKISVFVNDKIVFLLILLCDLLSTFAGWELCPHVSTCGHHIHISCYREYMQWVQRDETGYLRFEGGLGFQCPLCRQTSNIVIPCNIGDRVDTDQSKDAKIPSDSGASSGLQEYKK